MYKTPAMRLVGSTHRVAYCASKHAVEGMAKVMAWEYGKHGIRANMLAPTFIETDLTRERRRMRSSRSSCLVTSRSAGWASPRT